MSLVRKAETLGAGDMDSQLVQARVLELLRMHEEASLLVRELLKKGVTIFQIQAVHDLDSLRKDPHFREYRTFDVTTLPQNSNEKDGRP